MFLASLSFFLTFCVARTITHWSRGRDPGFYLVIGGVHVHHLVWGILILLLVGYAWLIQADAGVNGVPTRLGRMTALLYGMGAALTLDEFALWLRLDDVYWEQAGRASIDAVAAFGGLVSAGLWGGPFLRAVSRQIARVFRRHAAPAWREAGSLDVRASNDHLLVTSVEGPTETRLIP
jgi:hypothetical protein